MTTGMNSLKGKSRGGGNRENAIRDDRSDRAVLTDFTGLRDAINASLCKSTSENVAPRASAVTSRVARNSELQRLYCTPEELADSTTLKSSAYFTVLKFPSARSSTQKNFWPLPCTATSGPPDNTANPSMEMPSSDAPSSGR